MRVWWQFGELLNERPARGLQNGHDKIFRRVFEHLHATQSHHKLRSSCGTAGNVACAPYGLNSSAICGLNVIVEEHVFGAVVVFEE